MSTLDDLLALEDEKLLATPFDEIGEAAFQELVTASVKRYPDDSDLADSFRESVEGKLAKLSVVNEAHSRVVLSLVRCTIAALPEEQQQKTLALFVVELRKILILTKAECNS